MKSHGFAFILSAIKVDADLPVELAPKHWLDKAKKQQIEKIRSVLQMCGAKPFFVSPYENDIRAVNGDKPGTVNYQHTALSPEEWRYYVVNFEGTNIELETIQHAGLVLENEIRFGFHFLETKSFGSGFGWHPQSLNTFFGDTDLAAGIARSILADDLGLVSETYAALKELPSEFEHTSRAFKRFNELWNIPRYSELTVIGLFSVIESLLTHAPKLSESADSLMHQIRSKISLVRKRFVRDLDHRSIFGEIQEGKLWSKLYAYRSRIVHGEHATFDGELQVLRDRRTVVHFLKEATKLLLIASLREPVLMTDLKKC